MPASSYFSRGRPFLDEIDLEAFRELVQSNKVVTEEQLGNLLHISGEQKPSQSLTCKFYLMRCTGQGFRDADLIKFMLDKLIRYVLRRKEYTNAGINEYRRLHIRAKETFVRSPNTGEAGELLLFLLLEANDIVQLYSKMDLKTSGNVHFHGYDAIHIQVGKEIKLHFGHSKMHADFNSALDEALDDVKKFRGDQERERELYLISSHLDEEKFDDFAVIIRDLINPYSSKRELYNEVDSILIGSNWAFMKALPTTDEMTLDEFMRIEYEKQHGNIASTIAAKILADDEVKTGEFLFLIFPLSDVAAFRQKFLKELSR